MAALQWLKNNLPGKGSRSHLFRGVLWITSEQIVTMAIGIFYGIVLVRILTQADYGTYKYFFSLFAILQIFLWSGMNAAVMQATGRGDEAAFPAAVRFRLRWMPLFAFVTGSMALYYALREEYALASALLIVAILHPVSAVLTTYQSYLQGAKKFGLSMFAPLTTQLTITGAMLVALVLTKSLVIVVASYAIINILISGLFFFIFRVRRMHAGESDVLRYGKHLTFIDIIGIITQQLDHLLLFYAWGPVVLAQYAIAQLFPGIIYNFLKSIAALFIPLLAPKRIHEITRYFYRRLTCLFIVSASISAAYVFIAPALFKLFFPNYEFLVGYTQLLAIDLIWALPIGFIGSIFTAQKLLRASYGIPLTANAVRIVLYFSLGIIHGLQGMVIAYLISRAISVAISLGFWEYERRRADAQV